MKIKSYIIRPEADLRGANLQDANLQDANLQGANLHGAYLLGADLREANLREANLWGADLRGADLRGADLREANLLGANLTRCQGIQAFCLGMHFGFAFKYRGRVYVKIGCESHTLNHWLKNVDKIGKRNNYTQYQIEDYKAQLNLIAMIEQRKEAT